MSDLNVDDIFEVDTKLAKEYLSTISSNIHSLGLEDLEDGSYDHDNCHNKLCFVDNEKAAHKLEHLFRSSHGLNYLPSDYSVSVDMYNKLARKVEANAELFAQLEYMTRKISASQTKKCDIKLIVQNLLYWSTQIGQFHNTQHNDDYRLIIMNEKSPLSTLGCLAPLLCTLKACVIEASKETAVVCHLFTQLCHEVGIKTVYLLLVKDHTHFKESRRNLAINLNNNERLVRGGAGIVTGNADIDSAVDAFLTSATMFPWHLRRLLVQEDVYESFKRGVSWKTNLKPSGNHNCRALLDCYANKCTDLFIYDEKVFLLNYVGSFEDLQKISKSAIIVEAYRTNKELLTLIKQYKPHCISVWCSDIAEANEIAFGVDTSIIWINDINNFDGPPKISQAFYSNILQLDYKIESLNKAPDNIKLIELRNDWLKIDLNERREKIFKAIENCDLEDNEFVMEFARELRLSICKDSNNFFEIDGSRMCIGMQEPVGTIVAHVNSIVKLIDVIKSSIFGNGVVVSHINYIKSNDLDIFSKLIESLKKEGVPIIIIKGLMSGFFLKVESPYMMYKTRVIWTNFGTIFAN